MSSQILWLESLGSSQAKEAEAMEETFLSGPIRATFGLTPYQYYHLREQESLNYYPPQVVVRAFEFVEAAKKYGEGDYVTLDPLVNAKHLIDNAVVVADSLETTRTPIENPKLLQSNVVPQPYWKLPKDLQEHFNRRNYCIHELPALFPDEPAPASRPRKSITWESMPTKQPHCWPDLCRRNLKRW